MPKLRSLGPRLRPTDLSTVRLPPIQKNPVYDSAEYLAWRDQVIARAGGRCEAVVNGQRCTRAKPEHMICADHIVELKDSGSLLDIRNGQALCVQHHRLKTIEARIQRYRS
jgi:5-methylcytosine-specific restriction protein A